MWQSLVNLLHPSGTLIQAILKGSLENLYYEMNLEILSVALLCLLSI